MTLAEIDMGSRKGLDLSVSRGIIRKKAQMDSGHKKKQWKLSKYSRICGDHVSRPVKESEKGVEKSN